MVLLKLQSTERVLNSESRFHPSLEGSHQTMRLHQVGLFIDQLEHSDEALVVSDDKVVSPWIGADGCELEVSSAPIALLSLVRERLVEGLSHIYVAESPPVSIVAPEMHG